VKKKVLHILKRPAASLTPDGVFTLITGGLFLGGGNERSSLASLYALVKKTTTKVDGFAFVHFYMKVKTLGKSRV